MIDENMFYCKQIKEFDEDNTIGEMCEHCHKYDDKPLPKWCPYNAEGI